MAAGTTGFSRTDTVHKVTEIAATKQVFVDRIHSVGPLVALECVADRSESASDGLPHDAHDADRRNGDESHDDQVFDQALPAFVEKGELA